MRTTLTLDSDVVALLREEMDRTRQPFKHVVNRVLRLGLHAGTEGAEPLRLEPWDSGGLKPGFDYDRLGQLDDELETQEFIRQYRRDEHLG